MFETLERVDIILIVHIYKFINIKDEVKVLIISPNFILAMLANFVINNINLDYNIDINCISYIL